MARYEHLPIYKQALDAALLGLIVRANGKLRQPLPSLEQASNQFLPGDSEMRRHIGEDARECPDLQRIVRRDRHMVLRS